MALCALIEQSLQCPYCGEMISVLLDLSAGDQTIIEDCQVCCQPIRLSYGLTQYDQIWLHSERSY
jgi:transcription elongation factor Elf1